MSGELFGRELRNSDVDDALTALERGSLPFDSFFAENIRMDRRVGNERGEQFVSEMVNLLGKGELDGPPGFIEAFKDWFKVNVRGDSGSLDCKRSSGWGPQYCHPENYENRLVDDEGASLFPRETLLTTVVSLSSLGKYVYGAHWEDLPESSPLRFAKRHWNSEHVGTHEWVNDYMGDPKTRKAFVDTSLRCLWKSNKNFPYTPQWSTFWERFEHAIDKSDGETWVNATGTAKCTEGHWLIVLTYPVSRVSALYRPTQLDAGYFAYHYPSPAVRVADFAMNLDPNSQEHPLPEMIHDTLFDENAASYEDDRYALKFEDWVRTGALCATCSPYSIGEGRTTEPPGGYLGNKLAAQREAQRKRLDSGPPYP